MLFEEAPTCPAPCYRPRAGRPWLCRAPSGPGYGGSAGGASLACCCGGRGPGRFSAGWGRSSAGQVVQGVMAVVILLALPSPVRAYLPAVAGVMVLAGLTGVLLAKALPRGGSSRLARALRTAAADIRDGLLARRNLGGIVLAS